MAEPLTDSEPLKFRGEDAIECEEFIAAVLKHAFVQGKQRDDQWMADFAATCLAHDALRWWSELDDEVQGSWKLLRRAMLVQYRPLFYGGSGEEAEVFVRKVCDKAIAEGKQKDYEWTATYASSRLAGQALRWYASLDSATQENWKKLQQALLVQYPRDAPGGPHLSTVPIPAAASAPKPSGRGRIRVLPTSSSTPLYLSKHLAAMRISASSSLADALEVEWNPGAQGPQTLSMPDSQIQGYDVLGVRWRENPSTAPDNIVAVCTVNSQTNSTIFSAFSGNILTHVWKISCQGGNAGPLTVSVVVTGGELFGRWNPGYNYIWFAAKDVDSDYSAEVFFEPV